MKGPFLGNYPEGYLRMSITQNGHSFSFRYYTNKEAFIEELLKMYECMNGLKQG